MKLVEQIMSGAESDVGKLTARGSGAVKASGYKNVYFVAVEFTGAEFENDPNTGVWASNALDGSGVIMAVDPFAQIFTVFPDGDKTQAQIPQVGDDQSAAVACLR